MAREFLMAMGSTFVLAGSWCFVDSKDEQTKATRKQAAKLLFTKTNLKTLAELFIINTDISSKPWASTRHMQHGVVKASATFRYMQPKHRWSLPWQSVVLFFGAGKTGQSKRFNPLSKNQLLTNFLPFHGAFALKAGIKTAVIPKASRNLDMDVWKKRFHEVPGSCDSVFSIAFDKPI